MVRRFYNLPSLTALAAFEAAARHMSFKQAAAELNVTPGAVSRQIKLLEREIGADLFTRVHRGVELTARGDDLHAVLARSFGQMGEVFARLRAGGEDSVTVGASTAFASLWLMPRLGRFWRAHPDITLNHVVSDNAQDLRRADVDLRIRYGAGDWPEDETRLLFADRIFPVCSPEFARAHAGMTAGDLDSASLLHLEAVDPGWSTWEDWFDLAGLRRPHAGGRRFNNYAVILQAAADGQGIALGWERLVDGLIAEGKLARFTQTVVPAPGRFHVAWSPSRALSTQAEALRDWLIVEGRT